MILQKLGEECSSRSALGGSDTTTTPWDPTNANSQLFSSIMWTLVNEGNDKVTSLSIDLTHIHVHILCIHIDISL